MEARSQPVNNTQGRTPLPPRLRVTTDITNGLDIRFSLPATGRPDDIIHNLIRRAVDGIYNEQAVSHSLESPRWTVDPETGSLTADLGPYVTGKEFVITAICREVDYVLNKAKIRVCTQIV
jgi:hypothetical protein